MMSTPRRLFATGMVAGLALLAGCDEDNGSDIPMAPGGLAVAATSPSSLQVSWTASDDDVDGYEIARAAGANAAAFTVLDTVPASPFSDTGLTPDAPYTYRVVALRGVNRSPEVQAGGRTAQRGGSTLNANITANRTLSRDTVYKLSAYVSVTNGAVLTIQDGTRIEGDAGSALFITRGARIEAKGTAARPIVFTSSRSVGNRRAGDWGGLIIIGNGVISRNGAIQIEGTGGSTNVPAQTYGGTGNANNADNSGTLEYVRIEYAGFAPANNSELNSLTLAAVGSGTTMSRVQTMYGLDDSFEWFGGAVDGKYLVSYESGDDHFDASEGYVGRNQFLIAFQSVVPVVTQGSGSAATDPQGFEVDGCEDQQGGSCGAAGNNAEPFTIPIFANWTLVGAPTGVLPSGGGTGAVIRRGGGGFYVNGALARWSRAAILIDGVATKARLDNGQLVMNNILLAENNTPFLSGANRFSLELAPNAIEASAATTASLFTAFPATTSTATTAANFDWTPAAGSPLASGGLNAFAGTLQTRAGTFITPTAYRGAAPAAGQPNAAWWQGWTSYARDF